MLKGSCHCGKVNFELLIQPLALTECNCSICHRIGAIWAYADYSEIKITCDEKDLINYVWGDKMMAFCTCKNCGCTTHWKNLDIDNYSRMAVNVRMIGSQDIEDIPIRQFDGADSFEYID